MHEVSYRTDTVRIVFLAIGSLFIMFSPVIILFGPMFIPVTFFYEKYTWVYYTPTASYRLYVVGIILIATACIFIFIFHLKRWTGIVAVIFITAGLVLFVAGAFSYLKITPEGLKYRNAFQWEESVYKWSDVELVEYYPNDHLKSVRPEYTFTFKDGEQYSFVQTVHIESIRSSMKSMLAMNDVPFENVVLPIEDD